MKPSKIITLALVALAVAGFFLFDLGQYLTLEAMQARLDQFRAYHASHPLQTIGAYFIVYVLITGLSLPGALLISLLGGALFGLTTGVLVISFASTLGATLAMLLARFILRDSIQQRFGDKLETINAGIRRDGAFYLFTLRLIPLFPFFVINLVMGLTPIRAVTFFLVSQVGMLPGTIVFVNAGTQLGQLQSVSGILSPGLLGSFVLLGLFPLFARSLVNRVKAYRVYRGYTRPDHFDHNLLVIGAGAGGLVSAYIAAAVKARVALVEKYRMGGDCLNHGCVPSKALIRSARFSAEAGRAEQLGFAPIQPEVDFARVMQRVQDVIAQIEPHDSVQRYTELGVECIQGEAQLISPWEVQIGAQVLTARNIILATGSAPAVPPIEGVENSGYLTSDSIWSLRKQPARLLVIGGGAISCELSQAFARLGSQVFIIQRSARLLRNEDPDVAGLISARLDQEGVHLCLDHQPLRFLQRDGGRLLVCRHADREVEFPYDEVLIATGRKPASSSFGGESLGLRLDDRGCLETNQYLQTRFPNIYAVGDVAGPYQFTHVAAHQAWYAAVNALFGRFRKFAVDYSVIPRVTFTEPELAVVGLSEDQARAQGIEYELTRYGIDDLDRAIVDSEAHGLVKVLTVPGKDRILGVTICAAHAGELISEFVLAMRNKLPLGKILGTIHAYPTLSEANKYVAGEWKRNHQPRRILAWVERYHRWMRG